MIAFLLLLIIALLLGLRRRTESDGAKTWLNKETTSAINGFWILIVFLSHANSYISRAGYQYAHFGDNIYKFFFGFVGQLMVAMFLFNSGFGVMESIKAKGESYIRTMPKRRMLATLLNFDVAVLAFIGMNLIMGISMTIPQILGSFVCWHDVGNSNWYIFAILCCYLFAFAGFSLFKSIPKSVLATLGMLVGYLAVLPLIKEKSCWYNTIFAFGAGMVVAWHKERLFLLFNRHYIGCLCLVGFCVLAGLPLAWRFPFYGVSYNVVSVMFTLLAAVFFARFDLRGGGADMVWKVHLSHIHI